MSEKLFNMKPIGWNSPSSCCCNRMAPVVKLDASHSKQKRPDLDGKVSVRAEVTALFSTSRACCSAAPHDQSFDLQVSTWRGQAISEKCQSTTLCIKLHAFLMHLPCISKALLHTLTHCILDKGRGRPPLDLDFFSSS